MAEYATTKYVKTLRFPGDVENQYQVNAAKLEGHTWSEIEEIDRRLDELATFDALRYMGALAAGESLPAGAHKGDVYKVTSKGTIAGAKVEVGDMLICAYDSEQLPDGITSTSDIRCWDIIQGNVDVDAILAHKHTGTVSLTKTAKTLSHSVTPNESDLTATFSNGSASVTGNHGHTASGSFDYTPAGSVGSKSITPEGTVALTAPASAGTGDVTLKPSGTVAESTTEYVTGVTVSEHTAHNHEATFTGEAVAAHTHTVTIDSYTPAGSVEAHKHDVKVSSKPTASFFNKATYSSEGDDGVITFSTGAAVTDVVITESDKAPTFTGTAVAPTTKSVSSAGEHTPKGTISVDNTTVAAHTVTAPTSAHAHGFTGNNMYVHAAFSGKAASHTHDFTGTASTNNPVTVTVNNFTGNFTGSASGTVTPSLSKVLTGVTISNHSIETVDSATVTTGNGTQG